MHAKMQMQLQNPEFRFTGRTSQKSRLKSSPPIANYNSGTKGSATSNMKKSLKRQWAWTPSSPKSLVLVKQPVCAKPEFADVGWHGQKLTTRAVHSSVK
jgi:hypothetical protein